MSPSGGSKEAVACYAFGSGLDHKGVNVSGCICGRAMPRRQEEDILHFVICTDLDWRRQCYCSESQEDCWTCGAAVHGSAHRTYRRYGKIDANDAELTTKSASAWSFETRHSAFRSGQWSIPTRPPCVSSQINHSTAAQRRARRSREGMLSAVHSTTPSEAIQQGISRDLASANSSRT